MEAVIVAGGKGTRLGNLSENTPKALIKIGNKPVIEHQILLLKKNIETTFISAFQAVLHQTIPENSFVSLVCLLL